MLQDSSNTKIFLSIVIPCYNIANYIDCCIDSLRSLRDSNDVEFLFINDGSKDGTLDKLLAFGEEDSRVVLFNQNNSGVSSARNTALKHARGSYVLCLDGDDFLDENAVEIIRNYAKQYNPDILIPNVRIIRDCKNYILQHHLPAGLYTPDQLFNSCVSFPIGTKLVYKNDVIRDNGIYFREDIRSGEIFCFTVSVLNHSRDIIVIPDCFYNYVMRHDSAIHKPNYSSDITVLKILPFFNSMDVSWTDSGSFILTCFKMIMAFTYKKYLKSHLLDVETLQYVDSILGDKDFRRCRISVLSVRKASLLDRSMALYTLLLPNRVGYHIIEYVSRFMVRT